MPVSIRARCVAFAIALLCTFPLCANAKVDVAKENRFELSYAMTVKLAPAKAYAAVIAVNRWWDPEHSYSGKAANLSLDARAGGCWCEKLAGGGSVQHMTVLSAMPGTMLRLAGGLGPLQSGAVNGNMTWTFKAVDGGTRIAMTYLVEGYFPDGLDKLAAGVDTVLSQQLQRLQRVIETGNATPAK